MTIPSESKEKKHVSWGQNTTVTLPPTFPIPEGSSKKSGELAHELLSSRPNLIDALNDFENGPKRTNCIKTLQNIISQAEREVDSFSLSSTTFNYISSSLSVDP